MLSEKRERVGAVSRVQNSISEGEMCSITLRGTES